MRRVAAFLSVVVLVVAGLVPGGILGASSLARFDDVPESHTFYKDIEWLAATGITLGCNPPDNNLFCADEAVTRGQMAAFLVRALGLTMVGPTFDDTEGHQFEDEISILARAGITLGCNPPDNNLFCPDEAVTRGEMAAFLTRGLSLPPAPDQRFTDSVGVFYEDINSLAAAGITVGCNPPMNDLFCPGSSVSRGQMAAFLHRGLEETVPTTTTTPTTATTSTTQPQEFEPITIRGSGDDFVEFRIPGDTLAVLDYSHDGPGDFVVWAVGVPLFGGMGETHGRVLVNGWPSKRLRNLEIFAGGNWEITARPMSAVQRFDGTLVSMSSDSVLVYSGTGRRLTGTFDPDDTVYDDEAFQVTGYLSTGQHNEDIFLKTEDGRFVETKTIDEQTRILTVRVGRGTWTLEAP